MPVKAQFGIRYEEITRTASSMATVPVNTVWGFGDWGNDEYGASKA